MWHCTIHANKNPADDNIRRERGLLTYLVDDLKLVLAFSGLNKSSQI
jgi:hypothetical protein